MKRQEIISQLGGIELKNIDLTGVTLSTERLKISEEDKEFEDAVFECLCNPIEENKVHAIEEFWDCVQVRLSYLELALKINAQEVMEGYSEHLKKLEHRPRKKE